MTTGKVLTYGGIAVGAYLAWRWWKSQATPATFTTQGASMTGDANATTSYGGSVQVSGLAAPLAPIPAAANPGRPSFVKIAAKTFAAAFAGTAATPAPTTRSSTETQGVVVQPSLPGQPPPGGKVVLGRLL